MRVWLDPGKVAARGLTADDVVAALRAANLQVAAGAINQPPAMSPGAFQLSVQTLGRLTDAEQFGDIVVRAEPGRLGDAAARHRARRARRAGLHGQRLSRQQDVATAIVHLPAAGLECADDRGRGQADDGGAEEGFPARPRLHRRLQPHRVHPAIGRRGDRARCSRRSCWWSCVVILFLQTWRAAIIPVVAIPVSLIGCVLRDGPGRHLVQHAVAVRPGAGDRHRGRRRHRRGRERRALSHARACRRATRRTRPWTRSAAR